MTNPARQEPASSASEYPKAEGRDAGQEGLTREEAEAMLSADPRHKAYTTTGEPIYKPAEASARAKLRALAGQEGDEDAQRD